MMTAERRASVRARRIVLEEDIAQAWAWRAWYRTVARELFGHRWDDLARSNGAEIRRMVRDLRRERSRG